MSEFRALSSSATKFVALIVFRSRVALTVLYLTVGLLLFNCRAARRRAECPRVHRIVWYPDFNSAHIVNGEHTWQCVRVCLTMCEGMSDNVWGYVWQCVRVCLTVCEGMSDGVWGYVWRCVRVCLTVCRVLLMASMPDRGKTHYWLTTDSLLTHFWLTKYLVLTHYRLLPDRGKTHYWLTTDSLLTH